uniref:ORF II n=1 Tax=Cucumber mosaic virus satellite RNA TaxID=12436 RepID=Q83273_9VIRU|nr:ORF II [Cucumber mosaic virus satellite RNA]
MVCRYHGFRKKHSVRWYRG